MIVAGYIRMSTSKQELSPEVQRGAIEALAAKSGLGEVTNWYPDLAKSGRTKFAERPFGAQLLRELSRGDCLLVARMDRLGRNTLDILKTVELVDKMGIRLFIADFFGREYDSGDKFAKLLLPIISAVAEFENAVRRERIKETQAYLESTGQRVSRFPKPGTRYVDVGRSPKGKRLVVVEDDPNDRHWIEESCNWYRRGYTQPQILKKLHQAGAVTNIGRKWSRERLESLLIAHGGRKGLRRRWLEAQGVVASRSPAAPTSNGLPKSSS